MKINNKPTPIYTHEGGIASHINPEEQLKRSVMSCMLWEGEFYEDGTKISDRIKQLIPLVNPREVYDIAISARNESKLRHVPLLIARVMAGLPKHKGLVADLLDKIIQRPDELTEFLAIYWKDGRCPLSAQAKKGIARAFVKFDEYSLQKYNRDDAIKLRDVLFLCHAKPKNKPQEKLWKRLINNELKTPDTWEVGISKCTTIKDKNSEWQRLLKEDKLGGLALLRNLRNFIEAGVSEKYIFKALEDMQTDKILPFRFITAARYAPQWESEIEKAMMKCIEGKKKISGKTILLIDVSGSMDEVLSGKSEMLRMDAAMGLAVLAREIYKDVNIFSFSECIVQIPNRRGFALRDAIKNSQNHAGTKLGGAVKVLNDKFDYDRIIVFTDEQTTDVLPSPKGNGYIINIASYSKGIGYGNWKHINGFSEAVLDYINIEE